MITQLQAMITLPKPLDFDLINFMSVLVFVLLTVNFATPILSFAASMSGQTPSVFFYVNKLLNVLPFILTAIFFYTLFGKISTLGNRKVVSLSSLQAVLASVIFIMWLRIYLHLSVQLNFPFNFLADFLPIIFLIALYSVWILLISQAGVKILNLTSPFETLYLAINLVFALSVSVHSFKSVDFFSYFGFRVPLSVVWIFDYAPTLLVSFMSLTVWVLLVFAAHSLRKSILHLMWVILPVVFVFYVATVRPLVGYVLISAIVWGSAYEFFYPLEFSLSLVLLATTAFISSSILLGSFGKGRKMNLIRLSLVCAILAGMSLSPTSTLGVLLSLYFLFLGIKKPDK